MDLLSAEIERLLLFLKHEADYYNKMLQSSPDGMLMSSIQNGKRFFLHAVASGEYPSGQKKYRRRVIDKDSNMIRQLAAKEYARIALQLIERNMRVLELAHNGLKDFTFKEIRTQMKKPYSYLPEEALAGIRHHGIDDKRLKEWAEAAYEQSAYKPEEKIHTTSRGLKVRSRAELLIAEMLYRYGIPFRYEQVIHAGKYEFAPDFTFLGADGLEFYWEYCGMMSVAHYVDRQIWKRGVYEGIGMYEWSNVIYTYDEKDAIDMREIEFIIRTRIMPRMGLSEK